MGVKIDLTGKRFGRLIVIKETKMRRNDGGVVWKCKCDCGNFSMVHSGRLQSGHTGSCGCLQKDIVKQLMTTHGGSYKPEYSIWRHIIQRCTNKKTINYYLYGQRGISVCDRWRNSFVNFYADMGKKPTSKHTIERTNNNGNYEPNNCSWESRTIQARNKRIQINNKTGVNGIYWDKKRNKYVAQIGVNGLNKHLGSFPTLSEAATARKKAEEKYWTKGKI